MTDITSAVTGLASQTGGAVLKDPTLSDKTTMHAEQASSGAVLRGDRGDVAAIWSGSEGQLQFYSDLLKKLAQEHPGVYAELQKNLSKYGMDANKILAELRAAFDKSDIEIRQNYANYFSTKYIDAQRERYTETLNLVSRAQGGVALAGFFKGLVGGLIEMYGLYKGNAGLIAVGKAFQAEAMAFRPDLPSERDFVTGPGKIPEMALSARTRMDSSVDRNLRDFQGMKGATVGALSADLGATNVAFQNYLVEYLERYARTARGEKAPPVRSVEEILATVRRGNGAASAPVVPLPADEVARKQAAVVGAIDSTSRDYVHALSKAAGVPVAKETVAAVLGGVARMESSIGLHMYVREGSTALPSSAEGAFHILDRTFADWVQKHKGKGDIAQRIKHLGIDPATLAKDPKELVRGKLDHDFASRLVGRELIEFAAAHKGNPKIDMKDPVSLATHFFMYHNMGAGGYDAVMKGGVAGLRALKDGPEIIANNAFFNGATSAEDVIARYRAKVAPAVEGYLKVAQNSPVVPERVSQNTTPSRRDVGDVVRQVALAPEANQRFAATGGPAEAAQRGMKQTADQGLLAGANPDIKLVAKQGQQRGGPAANAAQFDQRQLVNGAPVLPPPAPGGGPVG